MNCNVNKVDSNITALSYAEEECFKQLPESGVVWYGILPNEYADTGGENTTVKRSPINASRQDKKGAVVDETASLGVTVDFTKSNTTRLLQKFFFAVARQQITTKPLNAAQVVLTSVTESTGVIAAASGLLPFNKANSLVSAAGFNRQINNGLKTVVSATAAAVTLDGEFEDETLTANATLSVVGFRFGLGELEAISSGGMFRLISNAEDFTDFNFVLGSFIFIGGDTTASIFGSGQSGFARIVEVTEDTLTLDSLTFAPFSSNGTGKEIEIYFGDVIKNEADPALIKPQYVQFERQLGIGVTSPQAEYILGSAANEFALTIPNSEKLTASLNFASATTEYVSGEIGSELKSGTRIPDPGEDAINTSENVYAQRLTVTSNAGVESALFGFIETGSVTISNGATPLKAVGTKGAFDMSFGNFVVSGEFTGYFTKVAAVEAIRRNANIGYNLIISKDNFGMVLDIPLVTAGGGRLNVVKDEPIKLPVTLEGAESKFSHTALYQMFNYLPDIAIAR